MTSPHRHSNSTPSEGRSSTPDGLGEGQTQPFDDEGEWEADEPVTGDDAAGVSDEVEAPPRLRALTPDDLVALALAEDEVEVEMASPNVVGISARSGMRVETIQPRGHDDPPDAPERRRVRRVADWGAEIVEVRELDDGAEVTQTFLVRWWQAGREVITEVTPDEWTEHLPLAARKALGPDAAILPGSSATEIAAIVSMTSRKRRGGPTPVRRLFGQLGWRRIGGEWVWLHAGGGLGRNGSVPGVEVALDGPLGEMALPSPPSTDRLAEDVRALVAALDTAPDQVTVPLFAAPFRAAMGHADLSLFVAGHTGAGKTTLALLAQACTGWPHLDKTPLSAENTPLANAHALHQAADTFVVVDDFVPRGDTRRLHAAIDQIVRRAANHSGRSRMRRDGVREIPERPVRALPCLTAEVMPQGESLVARTVSIEVPDHPGGPPPRALVEAQAAAREGRFAEIMASWVCWLAGQPEGPGGALATALAASRPYAGFALSRPAERLRQIEATWRSLIEWWEQAGVLDSHAAARLLDRVLEALDATAERHQRFLGDADPARVFLRLLQEGVATGQLRLLDQSGRPPGADSTPDGLTADDIRRGWLTPGGGQIIGQVATTDAGLVWLEAGRAWDAVRSLDRSEALVASAETTWAGLVRMGLLLPDPDGTHFAKICRLPQRTRRRMLVLRAEAVWPGGDDSEHTPRPDDFDPDDDLVF